MNCPACAATLERSLYEGLPVFHCTGCQGYLVATKRAADIARTRDKSVADLQQEAQVEGATDSAGKLRCPRCRRTMKKELQKPSGTFHIDTCLECQFVWFDAGELALSQLAYEATARSQEAARLQDRHRQMDPATKQQFEENLANLPESEATLESAFGEALFASFRNLGWLKSRLD